MFRAICLTMLLAAPSLSSQNVVVVLDDSGSMDAHMRSDRRTHRIDAAKDALQQVLSNVSDDAKVGVLALNSKGPEGSWVIPLAKVDRNLVEQSVRQIRARGGTPLGKFLKTGADALLSLREDQHYGTYRLLVVTDGEASDKRLVQEYLPDILSRGIMVDVIGVDMVDNHSLATQVHSYRRADDPAALAKAISEVLAESASDTNDADESDYEVLAAIPDEIALAALRAMAESGNQLIGTRKIEVQDIDNSIAYQPTNIPSNNTPSQTSTVRSDRSAPVAAPDQANEHQGRSVGTLLIIAACVFLLLFSKQFFKGGRR